MTGGTGAELQTSRIKVAADYRYAVQETKNIAEATSLVCARPGDLPTARGEYAGQTSLPGTRMQAPSARLPAVLTKLAGCLRLVNARVEQWADAQRRRAILTRTCAHACWRRLIHRPE
jgi:hypothetical protein